MRGNNSISVLSNFSAINEALTVPLPVNGTKLYFGNFQRLQDTLLQRFEVVVNSNLTVATTGGTLVTEAQLDKCYLYLLDKNGNVVVDGLPLSKFKVNTTSTATNSFSVFPGFKNVDIDWQKSYIDVSNAGMTTNNVVQVEIQYVWKPSTPEFQMRYAAQCAQEAAYNNAVNAIRSQYRLPAIS